MTQLSPLPRHAEVCAQATVPQLTATLRTAVHCDLEGLQAACFSELSRRLAEAGPRAPELMPQEALAALDSTTLARLLHASLAHVQGGAYCPPPLSGVRPGAAGRTGGFTFTVPAFSEKDDAAIYSPWVRVGGFEWRLEVYPKGYRTTGTGHLSGALMLALACLGRDDMRMLSPVADFAKHCKTQLSTDPHRLLQCS